MNPDHYINRETSWLEFNARVLALAERSSLPLLERVKFLAIWASNLDEFFQVRVAGLKEQVAQRVSSSPPDGLTPSQQLVEIRSMVEAQYAAVSKCFLTDIAPALAAAGVVFSDYATLDDEDRAYLDEQFRERVYPVVTPLAVDPAHPFPFISNLSLSLAVSVREPGEPEPRFARIKVPYILQRWLQVPNTLRYVPLEEVIAHYVKTPAAAVGHTELAHGEPGHSERQPIRLSQQEMTDLTAFLKTLSGPIVERAQQ